MQIIVSKHGFTLGAEIGEHRRRISLRSPSDFDSLPIPWRTLRRLWDVFQEIDRDWSHDLNCNANDFASMVWAIAITIATALWQKQSSPIAHLAKGSPIAPTCCNGGLIGCLVNPSDRRT